MWTGVWGQGEFTSPLPVKRVRYGPCKPGNAYNGARITPPTYLTSKRERQGAPGAVSAVIRRSTLHRRGGVALVRTPVELFGAVAPGTGSARPPTCRRIGVRRSRIREAGSSVPRAGPRRFGDSAGTGESCDATSDVAVTCSVWQGPGTTGFISPGVGSTLGPGAVRAALGRSNPDTSGWC